MATLHICDLCGMPMRDSEVPKPKQMSEEETIARRIMPMLFGHTEQKEERVMICGKCTSIAVKRLTDMIAERRREVANLMKGI